MISCLCPSFACAGRTAWQMALFSWQLVVVHTSHCLCSFHTRDHWGTSAIAGKAQTQPSAPTKPNPPEPMGVPGSANIRLSWDEPYHNGACICSYTLEQAVPSSHPLQVGLAWLLHQHITHGNVCHLTGSVCLTSICMPPRPAQC